ncbi:hypothetical protein MMC28_011539, partial [Mycoblastus sanguinarius]|nr:hypothetical protein [Mycoblastus sanguinarius]
MADLELTLSWLDMSQYLERFVRAGFDSWKTILEITENDLEASSTNASLPSTHYQLNMTQMLDVRLGHRRKLQREITNTKRLAEDPAIVAPLFNQISQQQEGQALDLKDEPPYSGSSKRGCRHHPKPDFNAPERPYSGYVVFSNDVGEQLKDTSPSFTEILRQVGLSWQSLPSPGKEYWRAKATASWQLYKVDVTEYRKTDKYLLGCGHLTMLSVQDSPLSLMG